MMVAALTGCNMPGVETGTPELDVTQALQTKDAQLTEAIAKTLSLTATPLPTQDIDPTIQESTQTPLTEASLTPKSPGFTVTPIPGENCDQAAAANPIDITIEDDSQMAPGEAFTKVWRVKNVGTCIWTTDYEIVFFSGELMGASSGLPLSEEVPPEESTELSVDMVAPAASGTYQGNWKLRNADGALFGIGPGGESPFWVRIIVVSDAEESITPTPTFTPTPEVQANGSTDLLVDDTLDLDSLQVNAGSPDLKYRKTIIDPRHQLVPLVGVTMDVFGSTQPSQTDCTTASLGGLPIVLEDISIGAYLCYRTGLGLPGWARLDGFDQDTGVITLTILTWKVP